MKNYFLVAFIALPFILYLPSSYACACIIPEVPQAFNMAHAVFMGEVTEIIVPRTDNPKAALADRLYSIRFKVEKSWKGVTSQEIVILSDQGRAGCFSWGPFLKGKKYVVYAERRSVAGARIKDLAVMFKCNRTALLSSASKDLTELDILSIKSRYKISPRTSRKRR